MSVDGYIDDSSERRLLLSGDEDFDRVDDLRAGVDAILVGAATIRADNPRLVVRSPARREDRRARGLPESPLKVTLTTAGDLSPGAAFFTTGDAARLVYCPSGAAGAVASRLGGAATVVGAGEPLAPEAVLADLARRGVRRLLVEGGGGVQAQFLAAGLVDELRLAVAPLFVGDPDAPRFAAGPGLPAGRMEVAGTALVGDMVVITYRPRAAATPT